MVVPGWEFGECGEGGDGDGGRLLGGPAGQSLEQLLGDERHERGYQPEHHINNSNQPGVELGLPFQDKRIEVLKFSDLINNCCYIVPGNIVKI